MALEHSSKTFCVFRHPLSLEPRSRRPPKRFKPVRTMRYSFRKSNGAEARSRVARATVRRTAGTVGFDDTTAIGKG
jgi:hypothetical protein